MVYSAKLCWVLLLTEAEASVFVSLGQAVFKRLITTSPRCKYAEMIATRGFTPNHLNLQKDAECSLWRTQMQIVQDLGVASGNIRMRSRSSIKA